MKLVQGQNEPEAWVDRAEMARQLGISTATLDRWVAADLIPSRKFGARLRRFKASVVIAALSRAGWTTEEEQAA